jgi:uncharacterized membrane protein YqhA
LNSDQERERNDLKIILDNEQRNLLALQNDSCVRLEQQHADEKRQLNRNVDERWRKLHEQVSMSICMVISMNLFAIVLHLDGTRIARIQ